MKIDTAMPVIIQNTQQLKIWMDVYVELDSYLSRVKEKINEYTRAAGIQKIETERCAIAWSVSKSFLWGKDILERIREAGLPDPPLIPDKDYLKENQQYWPLAKIVDRHVMTIKEKR